MADRNRYMYKCTEYSQLLLQYKKWQNGGGPSDEPRKTRLNKRAHNEDPCSKVIGAEHRLKFSRPLLEMVTSPDENIFERDK